MRETKHPVRTTEKTLVLIEMLKDRDGARIYELAEDIDLGEGAIHNHLNTLRKHGYVVKSGNHYQLSLKFLDLGGYVQFQDDLYRAAESVVKALARETGNWVDLVVEQHETGVIIARSYGPHSDNQTQHLGVRFNLQAAPSGKTILANLSEDRTETILDYHDVPSDRRASLQTTFERIRDDGYAIGRHAIHDTTCIAAPILTDEKKPLGALSLSVPHSSDDSSEPEAVGLVVERAEEIERNVRSMFLRDAWIESSTVRNS